MEKEISIKYLLQVLKKYAAIILIVSVVITAAAGVFVGLTSKPSYVSTAKVLIKNTYGDNILTPSGQINDLNYTLAILPTIIEALQSSDFLDSVNDAAGLSYSHEEIKSFFSYEYTEDSKIVDIIVKTPKSSHTKKICDAFSAVVPGYVEKLQFGNFDFVEKFRTPAQSNVNLYKLCLLAFGATFVLCYAACFILYEIRNKLVNENTDLSGRYQLPIIGRIPDFSMKSNGSSNKESGYYEKEEY